MLAIGAAAFGAPHRLFITAPQAEGWRFLPASAGAAVRVAPASALGGPGDRSSPSGWDMLAGVMAAACCAVRASGVGRRAAVREWEKKKAGYKPTAEDEAAAEAEAEKPPPPPFQPAEQLGVTEPLGYFDPLNFCPPGDQDNFRQLRAAEIKHGRVAMMASLGAVVQHFVTFPGFEDAPRGIQAVTGDPSVWGFLALFLFAGGLEIGVWTEPEDYSREPGDFGDPLGLAQYDKETRNKELNNGRLAMFTSLGIIAAELLTDRKSVV